MLLRFIVLLLLCRLVTSAQGASIQVEQLPSGYNLVTIEGEFLASDSDEFRKRVAPLSGVTVIFNSDGGDVVAGMNIGRTIRLQKFETWIPNDFRCGSACALAWLGSNRRLMGKTALIGFQALAKGGIESNGDVVIKQYLVDLGISHETIARVSKLPSAAWMNAKEAGDLGIRLVVLDLPASSRRGSVGKYSLPPLARQQNRASEFLFQLYSAISGPNSEALNILGGAYAETVDYFGKRTPRKQVLAYYSRVLERWPHRTYRPRKHTIDVQCDGSTCTAKGTLDFDARSPTRNERFVGAAKFEFILEFLTSDAPPVIVKETGNVLERRVERLREPSRDPGKSR